VGLDAAATEILNKLYNKDLVEAEELAKVICLFRLDFVDEAVVASVQLGKPVYMAIAMNEQQQLKLKPQNLLFNLPLAKVS
jgi:autonomous glycyl radical cofactor GrcA